MTRKLEELLPEHAVAALAIATHKAARDSKNFTTIHVDVEGEEYTITVQKKDRLTPSEKAEAELHALADFVTGWFPEGWGENAEDLIAAWREDPRRGMQS